jgi:hypothetical protein
MKVKILRRAYKACMFCRLRKQALRFYIALHTMEDGY